MRNFKQHKKRTWLVGLSKCCGRRQPPIVSIKSTLVGKPPDTLVGAWRFPYEGSSPGFWEKALESEDSRARVLNTKCHFLIVLLNQERAVNNQLFLAYSCCFCCLIPSERKTIEIQEYKRTNIQKNANRIRPRLIIINTMDSAIQMSENRNSRR